MTTRVTFANRDSALFVAEVKQRVAEYFEQRNLSPRANAAMVLKAVLLFALTFGSYGLILSGWLAPAALPALVVAMGVGLAGLGFSVAHDALHGAYSDRPAVNRALGLVFDLIGANGYMWKITHNVIHHTYTNIHGVDEDLTVSPLLRLSPHAEWRPFHRWQHRYGFLAYGFSTLFWVFVKDYKYFLQRDIGPYKNRKHPRSEWAILFATKAVYYAWAIVIPFLVLDLPWWQFLLGFLLLHLTAGTILGVVFQLAHVVEETAHPEPGEDGAMDHAWMVHEMETTSNFGRHNRLLCWYVGGLNFQIEHHLFPRICSIHYPAISDIVREVALKHGVRYNEHPTLRAAIASHYRTLLWLGRERGGLAPAAAPSAPPAAAPA